MSLHARTLVVTVLATTCAFTACVGSGGETAADAQNVTQVTTLEPMTEPGVDFLRYVWGVSWADNGDVAARVFDTRSGDAPMNGDRLFVNLTQPPHSDTFDTGLNVATVHDVRFRGEANRLEIDVIEDEWNEECDCPSGVSRTYFIDYALENDELTGAITVSGNDMEPRNVLVTTDPTYGYLDSIWKVSVIDDEDVVIRAFETGIIDSAKNGTGLLLHVMQFAGQDQFMFSTGLDVREIQYVYFASQRRVAVDVIRENFYDDGYVMVEETHEFSFDMKNGRLEPSLLAHDRP